MPLTKAQKIELKRIDSKYSKLEKLSIKSGFSLDEFFHDIDFRFSDVTEQKKRKADQQSTKRQQFFSNTKSVKPKHYS